MRPGDPSWGYFLRKENEQLRVQLSELGDRLDEIEAKKNQGKDVWDKLGLIAQFLGTVVIAGIALVFSNSYQENEQQLRQEQNEIRNLEAFSRMVPYLTGEVANEQSRRMGIVALEQFGDAKLAASWAEILVAQGQSKGALMGLQDLANDEGLSKEDRRVIDEALDRVRAIAVDETKQFKASSERVEIASWNLEHFYNGPGVVGRSSVSIKDRVDRISKAFLHLDADVYALTEVGEEAISLLSQELGEAGNEFQFVVHDVRGPQDLAVLGPKSKANIMDMTGHYLAQFRDFFAAQVNEGKRVWPRTPLFTRIEIQENEQSFEFILIVVHLKSKVGGEDKGFAHRKAASVHLVEIARTIRQDTELPVIIAGDFNADIDDPELSPLLSSGILRAIDSAKGKSGTSYIGGQPNSRYVGTIDHVFVTTDIVILPSDMDWFDAPSVRLEHRYPEYRKYISDHVPVVAPIRYSQSR